MQAEFTSPKGAWKVQVHDESGKLIHEEQGNNIIVKTGRREILKDLFGVGALTDFKYLGVGSGTTDPVVGDTALQTELGTTRVTCTNTSNVALSSSDVIDDATVSPYETKIVVQGVFGTGDLNGNTFSEFGLFSSATVGAGTMFNRFEITPISKTSSVSVTVQITIRC